MERGVQETKSAGEAEEPKVKEENAPKVGDINVASLLATQVHAPSHVFNGMKGGLTSLSWSTLGGLGMIFIELLLKR